MAGADDVGAALTGWLAQFAQRNPKAPQVIEGYTPDMGQRILDRRNDQTVVEDRNEFGPWYAGKNLESLLDTAPPPHTGVPLAKDLGYNDIRKPTPEEVAKFLADISEMDKDARARGPDMSADDLKTMNDPIGKWLRRDQ